MHITGGKFNSRKLLSPKGENVRPTLSKTRAAIFDVLYSLIDFDKKVFLDLFAGSGIMGLEAVSRGFEKSIAIEKDKKTYFNIISNYKLLGIEPEVYLGDSLKKISLLKQKFDVIYIDPPYRLGLYDEVLNKIVESNILTNDSIVVIERPIDIDLNLEKYVMIKQKQYSDKVIDFIKKRKSEN